MNRRVAFTLVEVVVALTLAAIVVGLSYSVLAAGVNSEERFAEHRQLIDDEVALRAMIVSALRHAERGSFGGPEIFRLAQSNNGSSDAVTFLSRGVVEPYGTGPSWTVTVALAHDTLKMTAQTSDSAFAPVVGAISRAEQLDIRVLGRGRLTSWSEEWREPSVAPQAVSLAYRRAGAAASPLVARIGLERIP